MKVFTTTLLLFFFLTGHVDAQDFYQFNPEASNSDNVGIFGSLGFNTSSPFIKKGYGYSQTAKGAIGSVPMIGLYYHKKLVDRFSIRASVALGYASYAFKYSQKFDSLTENFTPELTKKFSDYTRVKHGSAFVIPQIDFGYLFGPFKKMYLIEVRGGIGLHTYIGKAKNEAVVATGGVTDPKTKYTYIYSSVEQVVAGQPNQYGSILANGYVGIRWQKTTNPLLNHLSLGIAFSIPVNTNDAGYSEINYYGEKNNLFTEEKVKLSLFTFGIRAAYDLL